MSPFSTLVNFRDLGGIANAHGRTVKPHRLLRAGQPVALPEAEKQTLTDTYHLCTFVDLRTDAEAATDPDDTLGGVTLHRVDVLKSVAQAPSRDSFLTGSGHDMAIAHMTQVYRQLIIDPTAQAGYRTFIALLLAQEEGALLFHCFAGKDRTGLAAAIVLTALDVAPEAIMHDYLRTNPLRKEANEALLAQMRANGEPQGAIDAATVALTVREGYLETSYAEATAHFGSFDGYLTEALHVTADMRAQLQSMYLHERPTTA